MIDIHNHLLYDIDDGARDLEEAIKMCSIAEADGITDIVATPHYIKGELCNDNMDAKLQVLRSELKRRSINLEIFSGNEIYLALDTYQCLTENRCFSLNNSRYVLVEFSMTDIPNYVNDALYNLRVKGFVPIIAHPERNICIREKPQLVHEFVSEGYLIQVNSTSLTGASGKESFKTSRLLLKNNLVHFVASDAHSTGYRKPILSHAYDYVKQISGVDTAGKLFLQNPKAVVEDEEILVQKPVKPKKIKKIADFFRL